MEADPSLDAYFNAAPVTLKSATTPPKATGESDIDRYLSAPAPKFNKSLAASPESASVPPAAPVASAVNLKDVLAKFSALSVKPEPVGSKLMGAEIAQTTQGQKNQLIRELRSGKSDTTFRPLPQAKRLNSFTH